MCKSPLSTLSEHNESQSESLACMCEDFPVLFYTTKIKAGTTRRCCLCWMVTIDWDVTIVSLALLLVPVR
jgi:hypothetical protein